MKTPALINMWIKSMDFRNAECRMALRNRFEYRAAKNGYPVYRKYALSRIYHDFAQRASINVISLIVVRTESESHLHQ